MGRDGGRMERVRTVEVKREGKGWWIEASEERERKWLWGMDEVGRRREGSGKTKRRKEKRSKME